MRTTQSVPNMYQGVSRQDPVLRLPTQAEEQLNGLSTIANGLQKRPPSEVVAKISDTPYGDVHVHTINRDQEEQYVAVFGDGSLDVFDLDGNKLFVDLTDAGTYLNTATPSSSFAAMTVADTTFVVNKGVVVGMDTSVAKDVLPFEAFAWIKRGMHKTTYKIFVGGIEFSHTTPDPTAGLPADFNTETIAEALRADIDTNASFAASRIGSTIRITRTDAEDFTFRVTDSFGEQALVGIKRVVDRRDNLPPKAWDGTRVSIDSTVEGGGDPFYVEYSEDGNTTGVWRETTGWGIDNHLDSTTLPHKLSRLQDDASGTVTGTPYALYFKVHPAEWEPRTVGDEDTAPAPAFVGATISDVFFHMNRLGFLSGEHVCLSRVADYWNFFPETVQASLASDPVEVAASHTKVSLLKHAVPLNKALLCFSDFTQFQLGSDGPLGPETVRLDVTTEYETGNAKPVSAGRNVYFTVPRGLSTGVREYFVEDLRFSNRANDITAHVQNYLLGEVGRLTASSSQEILLASVPSIPNILYVYKWYWEGETKAQSCWSRWAWTEEVRILSCAMLESTIWLVMEGDDGVFLEKVELDTEDDAGLNFRVRVDRREEVVGVYDAETNTTTWTLLTADPTDSRLVVAGAAFTGETGNSLKNLSYPSSNTISTIGDWSAGTCIIGLPYMFMYKFSPIFLREGESLRAINEGRLQLLQGRLNFTDSGQFDVEVTPYSRDTYSYTHTGTIGKNQFRVGVPYVGGGSFSFPIMAKNREVEIVIRNPYHYPSSFQTFEWTGTFSSTSNRR